MCPYAQETLNGLKTLLHMSMLLCMTQWYSTADLCQLSATPEGHGSALQGSLVLQFLYIDNP